MKILPIDLLHPQKELMTQAVKFLQQGNLLIHPTETCYGFAVDIFQKSALELLYSFKNMPMTKPVSIMVRNVEEARKYAEFGPLALRLAEKFWPGPVTLVLPRKGDLPEFLNEGHSTVGIRCPDSVIVQNVLELMGKPLSTTSVNVSGQPEVYNVEDFLNQFEHFIAAKDNFLECLLVLDGGTISRNPPSTIVGFEKDVPRILRKGALWKEVEAFILF